MYFIMSQHINNIYSSYGDAIGDICKNTIDILNSIPDVQTPKTIPPIIPDLTSASQDAGSAPVSVESNTENIVEESKSIFSVFTYKIKLFSFEISVWLLILVLLVVFCIAYYIYNYIFAKVDITISKNVNSDSNDNESIDNNSNLSSVSSVSSSSSSSSSSSNSSNSTNKSKKK